MQDLESHWDNCSEISFRFFAEPFLLFKAHKPRLKKGWNMLVLVVELRASSHPIRWKHHNMMLWDELVSPQDETTVKQPHLTASQNTIQWSQSLLSTAWNIYWNSDFKQSMMESSVKLLYSHEIQNTTADRETEIREKTQVRKKQPKHREDRVTGRSDVLQVCKIW